jgi:ABC-type lipoprotein export system ATPase subunit
MPDNQNHNSNGSHKAAIELRQVVKKFKNAAGEFPVLKGVDITLREHEFISIIGKSGSGKSTLLNMITGIDHPTSGEVIVGGLNIYEMNESQRALWRGRNLGIVFQFFQLLPMLTLLENTMLPMDYCNVYPPSERPQRALELIKMVGLGEHAYKLPASVSTGQQQSAAIARALATDPPIIIADEPTGNLDSRSADIIIDLFEKLAQRGKTIAMVTHDPSFTERTSRTLVLSDGEVINETVAQTLPFLSHPQMLNVTHLLEREVYQPGAPIIQKGQRVDKFYMVANGQVEVFLQGRKIQDLVVARLGPGQFFGEVELVNGGNSIASVRAASVGPATLVVLHRDAFNELLSDSPLTQAAIAEVVQSRLQENKAGDRRCR